MNEARENFTRVYVGKIPRLVKYLQEGRTTPAQFCEAVFETVRWAVADGDEVEVALNPCVAQMPWGVLKLLSEYADAGYKLIDYAVLPSLGPGRYSQANLMQARLTYASVLRRLHEEINRQLQIRGGPTEGEVVFSLPKHLPGDPPLRFPGVEASMEPCAPEDVAARMGRYLEECDQETRRRFDAIEITPELMVVFESPRVEQVWVVGREGRQVLYYDHMSGSLEIGWVLTNGKIWHVWTEHSLQRILESWGVGPIALSKTGIDYDFSATTKVKLVVATEDNLKRINSTTYWCFLGKIIFFIEQADNLGELRVAACNMPPVPDLEDYLATIQRQLEKHRVQLEIVA